MLQKKAIDACVLSKKKLYAFFMLKLTEYNSNTLSLKYKKKIVPMFKGISTDKKYLILLIIFIFYFTLVTANSVKKYGIWTPSSRHTLLHTTIKFIKP